MVIPKIEIAIRQSDSEYRQGGKSCEIDCGNAGRKNSHWNRRVTDTFVTGPGSYSKRSHHYARLAISPPAFEQLSTANIRSHTHPTRKFLFKSNQNLIYAHFCISQLNLKKSYVYDFTEAQVGCQPHPLHSQFEERREMVGLMSFSLMIILSNRFILLFLHPHEWG